ncbi:MAG: PAS domain S-box protein [Oligoflexia bacterium]|nr:PAS domain S-box protein [Oligoflexia bacterium]
MDYNKIEKNKLVVMIQKIKEEYNSLLSQYKEISKSCKKHENLIRFNEFYENAFYKTPDALMVFSNELGIVLVNSASLRLFGYKKQEELINKNLGDMLKTVQAGGGPSANLFKKAIEAADHDRPSEHEWIFLKPDNRELYASVSLTKLKLENNDVYMASIRDISATKEMETERENMRKQLYQASKLSSLGEMAGGIAHELNNPLAVIQSYTDQLEGICTGDNNEYVTKCLEGINNNIQRMVIIISQLRSFSRQESSEVTKINLNNLIEVSLTLVERQFANRNIHIIKNYPKNDIIIIGAQSQLEQVLINLFINARDAMEQSPVKTLTIMTEISGQTANILIRDTGNGIKDSVREKIFNPFFTTKEVGKGTGLGLSVSYNIVKEHKGRITIDKSEPGKGTTFRISFPLYSE